MARQSEGWRRHLDSATRSQPARHRTAEAAQVPGLSVIWHPDPRRVGERIALPDLVSGRQVRLSRLEPLFAQPGQALRRPLADAHLSRAPVLLDGEPGGVRIDARGTRTKVEVAGSAVQTRTVGAEELEEGLVLVLGARIVLLLHRLPASPPSPPRYGLVGDSPALLAVRRQIGQVADVDVPVLVRGESGTGKELVARALHDAGPRRGRPYLAINLGAVPPSLAAAELFGVARGAFTGADAARAGYFARADGGSLFLDELGELSTEVQPMLLRVLESGEVQTPGAQRPRRVDVRLIAATDADLEDLAATGRFRAPLLHRLAGCEIHLPPLRRRQDDVGRLLVHFLERELKAVGEAHRLADPGPGAEPWLGAELAARLAAAPWPGNVRQLRNAVRQLVLGNRERSRAALTPAVERLIDRVADVPTLASAAATAPRAYRRPEEVGEEELRAALRVHRYRLQPAAAELGVSRTSLYALIERFPGIRKPRDLGRDEIEAARRRCGGDIEAMVDELQVSRKGLRRRMTELGMD